MVSPYCGLFGETHVCLPLGMAAGSLHFITMESSRHTWQNHFKRGKNSLYNTVYVNCCMTLGKQKRSPCESISDFLKNALQLEWCHELQHRVCSFKHTLLHLLKVTLCCKMSEEFMHLYFFSETRSHGGLRKCQGFLRNTLFFYGCITQLHHGFCFGLQEI